MFFSNFIHNAALYRTQGCIIIRGYATVHVEPLNEYQSNIFSLLHHRQISMY